jgi:hypothetical protein
MLFIVMLMIPVVMHAQENSAKIVTTTITGCDTYTWNVNGATYNTTGVYSVVHHDTVFVLDLTLGHSSTTADPTPVNAGCFYVFGGDTITTSGTHMVHFTSREGCDSAVSKIINIDTVEYSTVHDTVCQSTQWYGLTLSADTVVTIDTFMNSCHHNITLYLKVKQPRQIKDTLSVVACDRYSYTFVAGAPNFTITSNKDTNTTILSTSTVAMRNIYHPRTALKCYDSTFYLHVKINHSNYSNVNLVSCGSTQYVANDSTYIYDYTITDTIAKVAKNVQGCDSSIIVNVIVNQNPTITITGDLNVKPGSSATLVAGSDQNNVAWHWSTGENTDTIVINNITANTDISLTGTNASTACKSTNNVTILCNVGIEEAAAQHVNVYPNPATTKVNIESAVAIRNLTIFNTVGQQVYSSDNMGTRAAIDVNNYSNGSYTMRLIMADGNVVIRTMIVNK